MNITISSASPVSNEAFIRKHLPPSTIDLLVSVLGNQLSSWRICDPASKGSTRFIGVELRRHLDKVEVVVGKYLPYSPEIRSSEDVRDLYIFANQVAQNNYYPHRKTNHPEALPLIDAYQTQDAEMELEHSLSQMTRLIELGKKFGADFGMTQTSFRTEAEKILFHDYHLYPEHMKLVRALNQKIDAFNSFPPVFAHFQ